MARLAQDGELDADLVSQLEKKHRDLVGSLSGFVHVENVVEAALYGDRVSEWSLGFIASLDAMTDSDLRPVPFVSWVDAEGFIRKVAFA